MKFTGQDPYDALAAIFLGNGHGEERERTPPRDAGIAASAAAAPRQRPHSSSLSIGDRPQPSLLRVTAAITGHLPVMAGLWATQFADRVGSVDGATCLIRCERELIQAEILRSGGRQIGVHHGESFEQWLERAAQLIRRWVICLPAQCDPQEALDEGFAERVLLTSADEAAVAAAQRVVDAVAAAARSAGRIVSLGVVVVGAPGERVGWMVDQLGSQAHGSVDLPLAASIARMDRVESAERHAFEVEQAPRPSEVLRLLEQAASRAIDRFADEVIDDRRRPPRAARTELPPPEPVVEGSGSRAAAARVVAAASADPVTVAAPVVTASPVMIPSPVAPAAPMASSSAGATAMPEASTAKAAPSMDTPTLLLARHIGGVTALDLQCPLASAVELAVDALGRLHLIVPLEQSVALRAARAWANTNQELLRRAFPQLGRTFGGDGPESLTIVERVVTRDAAAVESLHGSGLALDLLVEVRLGASISLHHVPLNARAAPVAVPAATRPATAHG